MHVSFGSFTLDEPGRTLRCDGREVALQPRAFDLLVYLVRHRDRVVSKDELLDTLWPGVVVTDNSVQRAVSTLRVSLREGGMEEAIRNFPRAGYRFCADPTPAPSPSTSDDTARVAGAADAFAGQRWREAADLYALADASAPLGGADLDRWARALHCLGRPAEAIPVMMRAIAAHAEAQDMEAAAMSAVTLAPLHLERGEAAIARGYVARALDLLEGRGSAPARGLAIWMQARLAAFEGEPERSLTLADEAYAFGRGRGFAQVESLGLMYRGFARLSLGDVARGLADQDHAAALALSSRIDPITGSTLYCNILWACRTFGDWSRAMQWSLGYRRFCADSGMAFSGSCQLHHAEVLGVRGTLVEALAHVEDSLTRLADDTPWALGDAYRVLGDLRAAIGDEDAAMAAYERCEALGWDPEPGRAMLLLDRGEPEVARGCLERSLVGQGWWTLQRQGVLRAHLALACVKAGREDEAEAILAASDAAPDRWPVASIRALHAEARASLLRRRGQPQEALRALQLARELWTSVESRLNAARLRLAVADLLLEDQDPAAAAVEIRAALTAARDLGAGRLVRLGQALQQRLG